VYGKIARLDEHTGPHASHEFLFGYELAMMFDQRDKDLESATAKAQRLFAVKQQPLHGKQMERAKGEGPRQRTIDLAGIHHQTAVQIRSSI